MPIDFTRTKETIDTAIMADAKVVCVGMGGARRFVEVLAHAGIGEMTGIDHDRVETRNSATQAHPLADEGMFKTDAAGKGVLAINPKSRFVSIPLPWEEAVVRHEDRLARASIIVIATDNFRANRAVRRWAIARDIDAIDAQHYPGAACVEHVVTWADVIAHNGGCGTCHTKGRLDAFETGFVPPRDIPTNILAAELSCVQTAAIVIARLHQRAGSTLPIVGIAEAFQHHPFHLTRLLPSFWAAPGEPFADAPADGQAFFSRGYALDTPIGWVCPDCGCSHSEAP